MREVLSQEFQLAIDRGGQVFEDLRFVDCLFDNCALSLVDTPTRRSTVRSVEFTGCRNVNSDVGPARFEDVTVDELKSNNLLIVWAPLFRHVTFRGTVRSIKINRTYSVVNHHPIRQAAFDEDARSFYESVDWALDLTEAKLSVFEIEGVPTRLIRYDPRYGLAVSRASAEAKEWRRSVSPGNPWLSRIDSFLRRGESDTLLLAPYGKRSSRDGLKELADAGLGWADA